VIGLKSDYTQGQWLPGAGAGEAPIASRAYSNGRGPEYGERAAGPPPTSAHELSPRSLGATLRIDQAATRGLRQIDERDRRYGTDLSRTGPRTDLSVNIR
jgi:hypothetical protein